MSVKSLTKAKIEMEQDFGTHRCAICANVYFNKTYDVKKMYGFVDSLEHFYDRKDLKDVWCYQGNWHAYKP